MKKTTLILTLILLCGTALAQNDTIEWNGCNRYMWHVRCDRESCSAGDIIPNGFTFAARYNYKGEQQIHGVAYPICSMLGVDTEISLRDTSELTATICLWQYDSNRHIAPIATKTFTPQEWLSSIKRDFLLHDTFTCGTINGVGIDAWFPMVELYFDQPVFVADTFFLASWMTYNCMTLGAIYLGCCYETTYIYNPHRLSFGASGTGLVPDTVGEYPIQPYFFPIIAPSIWQQDTDIAACPAPEPPQLLDNSDNSAFLSWAANPSGLEHEISLGTHRNDPSLNDVRQLHRTMELFTDLIPGVTYHALLRNRCHHQCTHHDTILWSPWSQPLTFTNPRPDTIALNDTTLITGGTIILIDSTTTWLNDSTIIQDGDTISLGDDFVWLTDITIIHGGTIISPGTTAILNPSTTSPLALYPNPTNGELRVECGEWSIETMEIYDLQGRQVHRQKLKNSKPTTSSNPITLNLKHLPAGTYLLQATSPHNTTIKTFIKW